jgi:hypothetical protein
VGPGVGGGQDEGKKRREGCQQQQGVGSTSHHSIVAKR